MIWVGQVGGSLPVCVCQLDPDRTGSEPQWFHTLQVRRLRVQRGRSNSDPLGVKSCHEPVTWVSPHPSIILKHVQVRGRRSQWVTCCSPPWRHVTYVLFEAAAVWRVCCHQKPGLRFGTANSYLSLEKLGEGSYASVYKGISRSVLTSDIFI